MTFLNPRWWRKFEIREDPKGFALYCYHRGAYTYGAFPHAFYKEAEDAINAGWRWKTSGLKPDIVMHE